MQHPESNLLSDLFEKQYSMISLVLIPNLTNKELLKLICVRKQVYEVILAHGKYKYLGLGKLKSFFEEQGFCDKLILTDQNFTLKKAFGNISKVEVL